MPALEFRTNLSYWLSPYVNDESHEVGDGDQVDEWIDCSGLRNTAATQATAGNRPLLRVDDGPRGLWVVDFDGSNDYLEGPDYDTIAAGPKQTFVAFKADTVSVLQDLVSELNRRWTISVSASAQLQGRNDDSSPNTVNAPGTVVAGQWHIGIIRHQAGGTGLGAALDDPINFTNVASGATLAMGNITIGGSTTTNPTDGRIGEVLVFNNNLSDLECSQVFNYLAANWLDRGDPLEQAREAGSRHIVLFGRTRSQVEADLPLEFADQELFDVIHVAHPLGADPREQGLGWPLADSRPMRLVATRENMDTQIIHADLADMRVAQALWNSCNNLRSGDPRREGQAVIARAARNFTRTTKAWVYPPGGVVTEAQAMTELVEDQGVLLEAFVTQQLLRSSAIAGLTGVTTSGTGVGGSAISTSTASPLLFDTAISTQSWIFTAGSPHTADLYIQETAIASVPANSVYGVSIDHLTLTAGMSGALSWRLQRSVDNFYWNDSTKAWQSGSVWNACTNTASTSVIERAYFGQISTGGSVTNLTFQFGLPNGGTAGRQARVYHAQLEQGTAFPGSRVVTNGAEVDRGETRLWFANGNATYRPFPNDSGTFLCRFKPLWTTAEGVADGADFHLLVARHSTDPVATGLIQCYRFLYASAAGRFEMQAKDASTTWTAHASHTVTRLTEISVAGRWISLSRAQVGHPAGVMACFVNGTKGTDVLRGANPTESTDSQVWVGTSPRGRQVCGWLTEWRVLPFPMSDEEVARWAAA